MIERLRVCHIVPHPDDECDAVTQYAHTVAGTIAEYDHVVRGAHDLDAFGPADLLVMHYVGYGYHRFGAPWDLVKQITRLGLPLWSVFHELAIRRHADHNWTQQLASALKRAAQRRVIALLLQKSASVVTSCAMFADDLKDLDPWSDRKTSVLPLPSLVGVPEVVTDYHDRDPWAVVFGTPGRREAVYARILPILSSLEIRGVIDIGAPLASPPRLPPGCEWRTEGRLSKQPLTDILNRVRYGIVEYPEALLAKSSIFSAYVSHGCVPVVIPQSCGLETSHAEPQRGQHYIVMGDNQADPAGIQVAALEWHRREAQARSRSVFQASVDRALQRSRRVRTLLVASHPTQNTRPLEILARSRRVSPIAAYCCGGDSRQAAGEEWGNQHAFTSTNRLPLGARVLNQDSRRVVLGSFWGSCDPSIVRLVRQAEAVVVYGHSNATFLLAIVAAVLFRRPCLVTTDATAIGSGIWRPRLKRLLFPIFYNRIARRVLVPSSASQAFLQSLGVDPKRIILTPYASDERLFRSKRDKNSVREKLQVPQHGFVFLFVGKLISRKGILELLEVFLTIDRDDAFFVIVGDGSLQEKCFDLAGGHPRVRFCGTVPYDQLPAMYQSADITVHPARQEPWGLPVNESLLSGTPVISCNTVGSALDLVVHGESGWIVPPDDQKALRSAMLEAYARRAELPQMARVARTRLRMFSSRKNAQALAGAIISSTEDRCGS